MNTTNKGLLTLNKVIANGVVIGDGEDAATLLSDLADRVLSLESLHPESKEVLVIGPVTCTAHADDSLTFSWEPVENAAKYGVSVNGGMTYSYTLFTEFTWSGLEANRQYTIYVKAVGDNIAYASSEPATCSAYTTEIEGTQLDAPVPAATEILKTSVTVAWPAVQHATGYEVSLDGTSWTGIGNVLSYRFAGLETAAEYTFSVRAKGDGIYWYDSPAGTLTVTTADASAPDYLYDILDLNTSDWKFNLLSLSGTESFTSRTAMLAKDFSDSSWTTVKVPHDWSVRQTFSQSNTDYESGFLPGGDAVYRKHITVDSSELSRKHFLRFDGVYMVSEAFVNGTSVGTNKYGYNPFEFDITDHLTEGDNVIAVTVSSRVPNSRYYSGAGIFRSVRIRRENCPEISEARLEISSSNFEDDMSGCDLTVKCAVNVLSQVSVSAYADIYDASGTLAGTAELASGETLQTGARTLTGTLRMSSPNLWNTYDTGTPYMYTAALRLETPDASYVSPRTSFGIRKLEYKSDGIYINGSKLFLKGMSMHHDQGVIGAEVNIESYRRQLRILKAAGINAVRCCHNPYAEEYMNMLAAEGFAAIEELFDGWHSPKNSNTYDFARFFDTYKEDVVKSVVRRDINNPAVILWSIGNEVSEGATESRGTTYVTNCQALTDLCHSYDPSRGVTLGENMPTNSYALQMMNIVDVIGINYGDDSEYNTVRAQYPDKCIYGSETTSPFYTRNWYVTDTATYKYVSYDYTNSEMSSSHASWGDASCTALTRNRDTFSYLAGFFPWTGFDYIGEPTPSYAWPTRSSNFGIVDLCGFPKDAYYMYMSEYTDEPMCHLVPMDWTNWTSGSSVSVWVYTNCPKVKLYLNGTLAGTSTAETAHFAHEFSVPFESGALVANAYDDTDTLRAQDQVYTAGAATGISVKTDKTAAAPGSDVFAEITITDSHGRPVPKSEESVTVTVTGGTVKGTDNGYTACLEDLRNSVQTCFAGKCLAVITPDGTSQELTITVTTPAAGTNLTGSATISQGPENVYAEEPETSFIDALNPPGIDATDLQLSSTSLVLDNGGSDQITVTRIPAIASTEIQVTASSGISASLSGSVLTVSAVSDDITGTVTLTCGSVVKTVNVTVGAGTPEDIELTCDDEGYLYEYLPYTVTGAGSNYTVTSSNQSVVKVLEQTLYCSGTGTVTLTVTAQSGQTFTKQFTVTVPTQGEFYTVSALRYQNSELTFDPGTAEQVSPIFTITSVSGSDPLIIIEVASDVTVSGTNVTEYGVNSDNTRKCYLKVMQSGGDNEYWASVTMTVPEAGTGIINFRTGENTAKYTEYKCGTLSCTGLTLNYSTYSITSDDENDLLLIADVTPANTTDDVVWSSSENICTFAGGHIVGLRNGSTVITATCGTQTASCTVTFSNIYEDNTLILSNHTCNNTKQTWYDGTWTSTTTFYGEFICDTSNSTANIVSFGNSIGSWDGVHWHIYYPTTSNYGTSGNGVCIAMSSGSGLGTMYVTNTMLGTDSNIIRVAMNGYGLYINGVEATSLSKTNNAFNSIKSLTSVSIGTQEGSSHFVGTVNVIRIINSENVKDGVTIDASALLSMSQNGNVEDYIK